MKMHQSGIKRWSRRFGTDRSDQVVGLLDGESGVLVVLKTETSSAESKLFHTVLYRFDAEGEKIWERSLQGLLPGPALAVREIENGHLLLAGYGSDTQKLEEGSSSGSKDENAFAKTINLIVERSKKYNFTKIAAIESRGFVFASAVSYILKKPFIMLRKKNKLPADVHSVDFELEYGTATIEVHKDSINEEDKVLIIDDLIATGGTAEAAAKLVEISKGNVAAFVFVINLFDLGGSDNLVKSNYKVENLIEFPGH